MRVISGAVSSRGENDRDLFLSLSKEGKSQGERRVTETRGVFKRSIHEREQMDDEKEKGPESRKKKEKQRGSTAKRRGTYQSKFHALLVSSCIECE